MNKERLLGQINRFYNYVKNNYAIYEEEKYYRKFDLPERLPLCVVMMIAQDNTLIDLLPESGKVTPWFVGGELDITIIDKYVYIPQITGEFVVYNNRLSLNFKGFINFFSIFDPVTEILIYGVRYTLGQLSFITSYVPGGYNLSYPYTLPNKDGREQTAIFYSDVAKDILESIIIE